MAKKVWKKMKKLKIKEPKFEKWNELPPELKLECIKKLDFGTRCSLRCTCRLEKSLVDSQKIHIDKFELISDFMGQQTRYWHECEEEYTEFKEYTSSDKMIPSFQYVMEHAIIEELLIYITEEFVNMPNKLRPIPWNVKCMKVQCEKQKNLNFCLKRLSEKVEKIEINTAWSEKFPFDSILTIPQIIKVPFLKILELEESYLRSVYKLAQTWIKNDAKIGQRFDLYVSIYDAFEVLNAFKKQFATRIVQMETAEGQRLVTGNRPEKAQDIRIQFENPSKHILVQLVNLEDTESGYEEALHMTVIPVEMKETEYDWKWYEDIEDA